MSAFCGAIGHFNVVKLHHESHVEAECHLCRACKIHVEFDYNTVRVMTLVAFGIVQYDTCSYCGKRGSSES